MLLLLAPFVCFDGVDNDTSRQGRKGDTAKEKPIPSIFSVEREMNDFILLVKLVLVHAWGRRGGGGEDLQPATTALHIVSLFSFTLFRPLPSSHPPSSVELHRLAMRSEACVERAKVHLLNIITTNPTHVKWAVIC